VEFRRRRSLVGDGSGSRSRSDGWYNDELRVGGGRGGSIGGLVDARVVRWVFSCGSGDFVCARVRRMLAFVSRDRIGGAFDPSIFVGMSNSETVGPRESRPFAGVMFVMGLGENPLFARWRARFMAFGDGWSSFSISVIFGPLDEFGFDSFFTFNLSVTF
jgi:hypothetical protein